LIRRVLGSLGAALLVGCAAGARDGEPPRDRAPAAVTGASPGGKVWRWQQTATPLETIESPAPEHYTLELAPNGRLLVRADCNRGTGSFRIGAGTIALGPIATTRMACPPGSLDARYLADLQRAAAFFVAGGVLHLVLPEDAGTMRFAPRQ
jgi:heat shock protein HslJ